jgi:general secretion pathway protein D
LPPPAAPADTGAVVAPSPALRALSAPANPEVRTDAIRFDLAAPSQTAANSSFTVNLLAQGPAFEQAELDLVLDRPDIQMLKVEPRTGVVLNAKRNGDNVHISIGKATADGSLAMISFQADRPAGSPLNLSLQNVKVEKESHVQIPSTVALPRQIVVSP